MNNRKIWFITGAGRGMGVDFAKAASAAGNAVVASGRDSNLVTTALGKSNDLLAVKLDVTCRGRCRGGSAGVPWNGLAASTCWSTMLPVSTRDFRCCRLTNSVGNSESSPHELR